MECLKQKRGVVLKGWFGDNNIENGIIKNLKGKKGKSKGFHEIKIDCFITTACLKSHIDM